MNIIRNNKKIFFGIITGLLIMFTTSYADMLIDSSIVKYDNTNNTLESTNVQDVIDEIYDNTIKKYTITFDSNGGSGTTENKICNTNETCILPSNSYSKTGYVFTGWSYTVNGDKIYNNQENISKIQSKDNSNINLYALWQPIDYSITYNLDGGTLTVARTSYNIETDDFVLTTPSKDGYTFSGWTGSNGETAQTYVKITKGSIGNKSYTANWVNN